MKPVNQMNQMNQMKSPGKVRGGPGAMVPTAEVRSYYDHPIIKPPVWTPEIPWYFFSGGLAGASSTLAALAAASGSPAVARAARRVAAAGALASPVLLISDLGRPERALNMLRVAKVTSPMSVGTWLLSGYAPAAVGAALLTELNTLPGLRRVADAVAAALGPALGTYTAGLVANTAVPVWQEARTTLPFVFAGGSAASAGAAASALLPAGSAGSAMTRRVALAGAALEGAAMVAMERSLGSLASPYHEGRAGRFARAAKGMTASGAILLTTIGRRKRSMAVAGAGLMLAGQVCERWAVFRAGFQSAERPADTVALHRARLPPSS